MSAICQQSRLCRPEAWPSRKQTYKNERTGRESFVCGLTKLLVAHLPSRGHSTVCPCWRDQMSSFNSSCTRHLDRVPRRVSSAAQHQTPTKKDRHVEHQNVFWSFCSLSARRNGCQQQIRSRSSLENSTIFSPALSSLFVRLLHMRITTTSM